jgi:hypothetical protein
MKFPQMPKMSVKKIALGLVVLLIIYYFMTRRSSLEGWSGKR